MSAIIESEQKLKEEAIAILGRHLPPHKVSRLLALWQVGKDDYVQQREAAFAGETVDSLFNLAAGGARQVKENLPYAVERGIAEEEAIAKGMEEKSKEFVEKGAEVYTPA